VAFYFCPMEMNQLKLKNQRVLIRVDFNVPLDKDHKITDDTRIVRAVPTLKYLLDQGASIIILSHLGRPQKKLNADGSINKEKFTLRNLRKKIAQELNTEVHFADSPYGNDAVQQSLELKPGEVLLVENTRFHKQEAQGDLEFASRLSALGDIYVNDAFGTAHRAHASTTTVAQFFPKHRKAFGLLLNEEIKSADALIGSPKRPFVAIIGGAKVSDKIQLLERLIEKVNKIIIGGGMAYTFIKAQGGQIGKSLCEDDFLNLSLEILEKAKSNNVEIILPPDSLCNASFEDTQGQNINSDSIPKEMMALDIGPASINLFKSEILGAKSILWNGPLGVFEFRNYNQGTFEIAKAVAEATGKGAFSLIGGGDSVSAINQSGLSQKVSHISTGGGAMLEYLEGKVLPGIQAILD